MSEQQDLRDRLVAATLGDYDILDELGRGGMATVYLAHDLALDRRVAIKVMSPELVAIDGMADRFLQEARTAASLAHPGIIPIYAVRRSGGILYFVMKFVAGRSLDAVLATNGELSVPMVRAILTQVGAALESAHRRGVVHRDIKPANLLLDEHGDVVVADFGIARVAERPGATQAGQTLGTPEYMSPEQCGGDELSGAADQYSLGVVAYELLTGAPPFAGDNLVQIVWKMVNEPVVPLRLRRPDCAGPVADAVHRMLERQASARWPSVAAAVAALGPLHLADGDPVRAAMRELAGAGTAAASRRATPLSPLVQRRVCPDVATQLVSVAATVTEIRLPPAGTMSVGDEMRLTPTLRDRDGAIADAAITWLSSDPSVARVRDGEVVAAGIGTATISASAGDAMAVLALTVTRVGVRALRIAAPPASVGAGDVFALAVATGEAAGALPSPRLVGWSSSRPDIASVDGAGRVVARAAGEAVITARAGGSRDALTLRVAPGVVATVKVSPSAPRLSVGQAVRLTATATNPGGHPLEGIAVEWKTSDAAIARVTPDGVLLALRSGLVSVAARAGGRVGVARAAIVARSAVLTETRPSR